jgi:hypothetical protein
MLLLKKALVDMSKDKGYQHDPSNELDPNFSVSEEANKTHCGVSIFSRHVYNEVES